MVNEVIKKIEEQQKKLTKNSHAYWVGEHLKDICKSTPEQAELILRDLDNPDMSIVKAEKKISEYARKNGNGCGGGPGSEVDNILREFYGLAPASGSLVVEAEKSDIIDLADFFG